MVLYNPCGVEEYGELFLQLISIYGDDDDGDGGALYPHLSSFASYSRE